MVNGFNAYHAVPTNGRALRAFREHVKTFWYRTLKRRSQRDKMTWKRLKTLADEWLPEPRILHPWPSDRFAVIGRHPEVANLVLACGFSGYGVMHALAAGIGASELILHGEARSVDLKPFAFERIAATQPIPEHTY